MIQTLISWILLHPQADATIILGAIELFLRLFPTSKNYSLLSKLVRFLNFVIPNIKDKKALSRAEEDKIILLKKLSENPKRFIQ